MSQLIYASGIPRLPDIYETQIKSALDSVSIPSIKITSTIRTPKTQADAMYNNILSLGVDSQKKLYGPNGNNVIDVYILKKNYGYGKADTLEAMEQKIIDLGPENVSRHLTIDPLQYVAFDVSPDSIPTTKRNLFIDAMKKIANKILTPTYSTGEPVFHLEMGKKKSLNNPLLFFGVVGAATLAVLYINNKKETDKWFQNKMKKMRLIQN